MLMPKADLKIDCLEGNIYMSGEKIQTFVPENTLYVKYLGKQEANWATSLT